MLEASRNARWRWPSATDLRRQFDVLYGPFLEAIRSTRWKCRQQLD